MERRFEVKDGAQVITCAKCGAESTAARNGGRAGGNLPPAAVARFFSNRGWRVGPTARKDLCPDCHHPKRKDEPKLTKSIPERELTPPVPGASAQPPREATREHRRLIWLKLEEVYEDEKVGYSPGWNDERVAKDLAVPRAWVEEIRDLSFGPQKAEQSEEIVLLNKRIATLETDAKDLQAKANDLGNRASEIVNKASAIFTASDKLTKQAEALRAEVKRMTGTR